MEVSKVPFRGCNCQNCDTARKLVAPEGIPDEVVGLISKHDSLVSKALATNTNLSLDIYLLLAEGTDASGEVRKSLAENPSVPLKVLERIDGQKEDPMYSYFGKPLLARLGSIDRSL